MSELVFIIPLHHRLKKSRYFFAPIRSKMKEEKGNRSTLQVKQLNERLDQNQKDTNLVVEAEHIRLELQKIS